MNTNPISSNTTASSSVTTGSTTTTTTPRMRSDTYPSGEPHGYQASRSGASESDLQSRGRPAGAEVGISERSRPTRNAAVVAENGRERVGRGGGDAGRHRPTVGARETANRRIR
jgi:hypothetical protein